jgi:hypothetical protein
MKERHCRDQAADGLKVGARVDARVEKKDTEVE